MRSVAVALALLLAGCMGADGPAEVIDEPPIDAHAPEEPMPDGAPKLQISQAKVVTVNASVMIEGTVDVPVLLSFEAEDVTVPPAREVTGAWSATMEVPHGATNLTVIADTGTHVARAPVDITRLAQVTMQVTYRGDLGMTDRDDSLWFNPDNLLSARSGQYEGCAQGHPGYANVHDAMMEWTKRLGPEVTYGACGDFGVSVEAIEGHESPGFWCFDVNGEAAQVGITLQPIEPGDVVSWDDCALVLG